MMTFIKRLMSPKLALKWLRRVTKFDLRISMVVIVIKGLSKSGSAEFNRYIDSWQANKGDIGWLIFQTLTEGGMHVASEMMRLDTIASMLFLVINWLREKLEAREKPRNPILPMDD